MASGCGAEPEASASARDLRRPLWVDEGEAALNRHSPLPSSSSSPPLPSLSAAAAVAADADALVALVKKLNEALPQGARATVDEAVVRKLAHCAGGEINPIAAMFGGVVGQEVMKAMSGKV